MTNRDELRRLLENLAELLTDENYHPGLMCWHDLYHRALAELKDWINA